MDFWSNNKHQNRNSHLFFSQWKEELFVTGENWCDLKYCTLRNIHIKTFSRNTWIYINYILKIRQYLLSINKYWYVFQWNIPMYEFEFRVFLIITIKVFGNNSILTISYTVYHTNYHNTSWYAKISPALLQPANPILWSFNENVRLFHKIFIQQISMC